METLLQTLGLTSDEFFNLLIIAVAAVIALGILRVMFRLTATLVRMGCAVVVIGLGVLFVLNILN